MAIKKEMSAVGAVAPSGSSPIPRPKTKRKRMNRKTVTRKPSISEELENQIRESILEVILEQENPLDNISTMFDNVVGQINSSLRYTKIFIGDGIKFGGDECKFNMKRAKAELNRVRKLSADLQQMIDKIYETSVKMKRHEEMKSKSKGMSIDQGEK